MELSTRSKLFKASYYMTALLVTFAAVMQVYMAADGDKSWLLLATNKMLEGRQIYVDIIEVNPPLILWLYSIPAYLGKLSSIHDAKILAVIVLALTGYSLILCASLLKYFEALTKAASTYKFALWFIAFVLIFWPNSIYFADREHIFFTLVLPYFIRFIPAISQQNLPFSLRLRVSILAAIGFCIKPHLLVFFIAVQVLNLLFTRNWRIVFVLENWLIGSAWVGYIILIYLLTPTFFTFIVPMLLSFYSAYKNVPSAVFFLYCPAVITFFFAFAGVKWRIATPFRDTLLYLLGLMLAGVGYITLNNGWLYTFYPLNSLVMLGVALVWLEYRWIALNSADKKSVRDANVARYFCAFVVGCNIIATLIPYGMMFFGTSTMRYREQIKTDFMDVLQKNSFKSFGQLFSRYPWDKLVYVANSSFETRFRHDLPMSHYLRGDEAFKARNAWWIPSYLTQSMAEDLDRHKPEIVFVDTSPDYGGTGAPFDVVQYLSSDKKFVAAWSHYEFFQRINRCGEKNAYSEKEIHSECQYDVFRRSN